MKILPITFFITKVHSRCNLNCSYCYEYNLGNDSWKSKPKKMTMDVFKKLIFRIDEHYKSNVIDHDPFIALHGGEPLLQKPEFFDEAICFARSVIPQIKFGMQTNGVLLNQKYIDIFLKHKINVGVSLDGEKAYNDERRVDLKGEGTFDRTYSGLKKLLTPKNRSAFGGILSVINIKSDPKKTIKFFNKLSTKSLDLLEPDGNYENLPPYKSSFESTEYADWLIGAYDYWIENATEIKIRRFEEIIERLYGGHGQVEYFGVEPANLITVSTDGSYEAVDQIKGAFNGAENLGLNIFDNTIDEVVKHDLIQQRLSGENQLSNKCLDCEYKFSCGGGYFPHRYSKDNLFKNPTIYCSDYKKLFKHIEKSIRKKIA